MVANTKHDLYARQPSDQIFVKCVYKFIPLLMFHVSDDHNETVTYSKLLFVGNGHVLPFMRVKMYNVNEWVGLHHTINYI